MKMKILDYFKILKSFLNDFKNIFKKVAVRRQDLPQTYIPDCYIDAIKVNYLIKEKKFSPNKMKAINSVTKYFVDIDTKEDINFAEILMKYK